MNILQLSLLLVTLLKCVTASESVVVNEDVIRALKESGFEIIKREWWGKWMNRSDLFDHMAMKDPDFIAEFINQVESAKSRTLAALFIKRPEIVVDQVLRDIKYDDIDLKVFDNSST